MAEPSDRHSRVSERQSSSQDSLSELRDLLLRPEKDHLRTLQERLDDLQARAREMSRVLPWAISLRPQDDKELPNALLPAVEEAIQTSVRRNPVALAVALYPVLGPSIRKSLANWLQGLIQSFNQTLERSLSIRGLQWRLQAWRTGKPFAEVVLLHTPRYRVEQVFLIHKDSGLILQHIVAPTIAAQDPDLVSGMLTAIQDFVKDSFRGQKGDELDALTVAELSVWIERGPEAVLAVVIRGNAPSEMRPKLQEVLEQIHTEKREELRSFGGDAAPFEAIRPSLEACFETEYLSESARSDRGRWGKAAIVLLLVLAALAAWLFTSARDQRRWTDYLSLLGSEPGIVVTGSEERGGKYHVFGLRDPLARDPSSFLEEAGVDASLVISRWEPYYALDPKFLEVRARKILQPPETVQLRVEGETLHTTGFASHQWVMESRRRAFGISGIAEFQSDVRDIDLSQLGPMSEIIEELTLAFPFGTPDLGPGEAKMAQSLAGQVKELIHLAGRAERTVQIEIRGHTDNEGTAETNQLVSRMRAQSVLRLLVAEGVEPKLLRTTGVGFAEPLTTNPSREERGRNRRVSFHVTLEDKP